MNKNCDLELTEKDINSIFQLITENDLKFNLINKNKKFKKENEILKDKNLKLCPIPDCGGYASILNRINSNILICNNNHEFCFKCMNAAHPKKNCEDILYDHFKKWKIGKIIKKCPKCKFWTEKNDGCNHMTCLGCKYQWCWLCSSKCTELHYKIGLCKGLQFSKKYKNINIFIETPFLYNLKIRLII